MEAEPARRAGSIQLNHGSCLSSSLSPCHNVPNVHANFHSSLCRSMPHAACRYNAQTFQQVIMLHVAVYTVVLYLSIHNLHIGPTDSRHAAPFRNTSLVKIDPSASIGHDTSATRPDAVRRRLIDSPACQPCACTSSLLDFVFT